jgi:geranyl-CoA carboxylase alpha subunit
MASFSKVLVANRGEIACRVLRTARAMGYRTVAIHSDADRGAPHTALADESVAIGGAAARESYLDAALVLSAAKATGADAVHPGYGFLSENAAFAEACAAAGVIFVGPPPSAIRLMGDKAAARATMEGAAVGPVPGYSGADQSPDRLEREATRIGFPLLVKAAFGGGGRGIRVVRAAGELGEAVAGARREAESAFGDGSVLLERFIDGGRHIEVQVLADTHGNGIFLGERDCSAQRRRQKVIEEAPSPSVNAELRDLLGKAAVRAALSVGYVGAGTVEFIVGQDGTPFFLEMNTRLQVEHPVTECITGLDIVRLQLAVAEGKALPLTQSEVRLSGHAIEARLYAEDPYEGFAPQTGTVQGWTPERATALAGVRVDDGIQAGTVISPHYDAMVAKIIAHGGDREEARRRLVLALCQTPLFGIANNRTFLVRLLESAAFRDAAITTTLLDEWVDHRVPLVLRPAPSNEAWALAAVLRTEDGAGDWFRSAAAAALGVTLDFHGDERTLAVTRTARRRAAVSLPDGATVTLEALHASGDRLTYTVLVPDQPAVSRSALFCRTGRAVHLALGAEDFVFVEPSPLPEKRGDQDPRRVRAPLAGVVAAVSVEPGAAVKAGDTLGVIEAMKMETRVVSRVDGSIRAVHAARGDSVEAGALLFELELPEKD